MNHSQLSSGLELHRDLLRALASVRASFSPGKDLGSLKKIGLDMHGVISETPEYLAGKARDLVDAGHQVHIMTGAPENERLVEELASYGFQRSLNYTNIFSITDHLTATGVAVEFRDGLPYADAMLWNCAKGEYAATTGLDCLWDDSPVYGRYMPEDCWYFTYSADNFEKQLSWVINGGRLQVGRK